jgi:NADP-dependent 3-hydroxy acid dehydrogenase YdfG
LELFRSYYGITEQDSDRAAREKITGRMLVLDETLRDVPEHYGQGHALPCTADVSDRESLRELVERTCAQWDAIDILVLNAVWTYPGFVDG